MLSAIYIALLGLSTLCWDLSFLFSICSLYGSCQLVHLRQQSHLCAGDVGEYSGNDFSRKVHMRHFYVYFLIGLNCKYLQIQVTKTETITPVTVNP